jgi:hypothetical protein
VAKFPGGYVQVALLLRERGWIGCRIASSVASQTARVLGGAASRLGLEAVRNEVRYAGAAVAQLERKVDNPVLASHERVPEARIECPPVSELDLHAWVIAVRRRERRTKSCEQGALRDPR